jgi:hypothetical protein
MKFKRSEKGDVNMNSENLESIENLENRITDILSDVKTGGLSKDSIAMILCLENEIDSLELQIDTAESLIRLLKEKKVFAEYDGDRNKNFDIDHFLVISRRHDQAIKYLENMGF